MPLLSTRHDISTDLSVFFPCLPTFSICPFARNEHAYYFFHFVPGFACSGSTPHRESDNAQNGAMHTTLTRPVSAPAATTSPRRPQLYGASDDIILLHATLLAFITPLPPASARHHTRRQHTPSLRSADRRLAMKFQNIAARRLLLRIRILRVFSPLFGISLIRNRDIREMSIHFFTR